MQVRVTLTDGGAGTVAASLVLDAQAVAAVGDRVEVQDLRQQGWSVVGPVASPDGSETLTVAHPFANPGQAATLIARLGRPLRIDATSHRHLTSSSVGLHGVVDLRGGIDALAGSTPALPAGVGAAIAAVARAGGTVPTIDVQVVAAFPAPPTGVVGGGRVAATTVTWDVPLGTEAAIGATSTRTDATARHWLEAAGACLIGLLGVLAFEAAYGSRRRATPEAVTPPP